MNKKSKKAVICFLMLITLLISLTGCGQEDINKTMQEKVKSELSYLDKKIVEMLNEANGISLENYLVKAEQIKEEASSQSSENDASGQSESGSDKSSGGGKSEQSGTDSKENSSQSDRNNLQYKMEANGILLQNRQTNWNSLKADIEKLYAEWSTIELDLYKVNANNQDILSFSTDLDLATQAIKSGDKPKTLTSLAKLYSYIPKYASVLTNNNEMNNLYYTKSSILNAYTFVEQDNYSRNCTRIKKCRTSLLTNH